MAQQRYIKILPDIMVMQLDGKKPYYVKSIEDPTGVPSEHVAFIIARTADACFGVDGITGMASALCIRQKVRDLKPDDILSLDLDDWERLAAAIRMPSERQQDGTIVKISYNAVAGPQLLSFGLAVLEASSVDPRKVVTVPEAENSPR